MQPSASRTVLSIPIQRTTKTLIIISSVLVYGSLIAKMVLVKLDLYDVPFLVGLSALVDVDTEQNLTTFYSGLLLLAVSLLTGLISLLKNPEIHANRNGWRILSVGFLIMTGDEIFSWHERLVVPTRMLLGDAFQGVFFYAWALPGIIVTLLCGILLFRFFFRLPPKTQRHFAIAGAVYISGALGMEILTGIYLHVNNIELLNLQFYLLTHVEEALEIAGLITFLWATLTFLEAKQQTVEVSLSA